MKYLQRIVICRQHREIQINVSAITFKFLCIFLKIILMERGGFFQYDTYYFVPIHYRKQYDDIKQYSIFARFVSTDTIIALLECAEIKITNCNHKYLINY